MPKYRYKAARDGLVNSGTIDANTKSEATKRLKAEGYTSIRIKRAASDTNNLFRRFLGR